MNEMKHTSLKEIYLLHSILARGTQFVVSLRNRWRGIYSEGGLLPPYLLTGTRGCQRLQPFSSRIIRDDSNASDQLLIPGSTLDSDWTDCLNLTAWFSYYVVSFRFHTCLTGLHYHPPVYKSQRDSLSKHTGSPGTNPKSMSTVII